MVETSLMVKLSEEAFKHHSGSFCGKCYWWPSPSHYNLV